METTVEATTDYYVRSRKLRLSTIVHVVPVLCNFIGDDYYALLRRSFASLNNFTLTAPFPNLTQSLSSFHKNDSVGSVVGGTTIIFCKN